MRKQPRTPLTRRNRSIGFTDTEWNAIGKAAAGANVSKSRYVVDRVLHTHEERSISDRQLQVIMAHRAIVNIFDQLCALLPNQCTLLDALAVADELYIMNQRLDLIVNLSLGVSENIEEGRL